MTLCETLQQRWQACRARVYGEEMISDFAFCNLWQRRFDSRPCCSPKRNQCRAGKERCARPEARLVPLLPGGSWNWFCIDPEGA